MTWSVERWSSSLTPGHWHWQSNWSGDNSCGWTTKINVIQALDTHTVYIANCLTYPLSKTNLILVPSTPPLRLTRSPYLDCNVGYVSDWLHSYYLKQCSTFSTIIHYTKSKSPLDIHVHVWMKSPSSSWRCFSSHGHDDNIWQTSDKSS